MFRKLTVAALVAAALSGSAVAALAGRSANPMMGMGGMGATHNVLRPAFFGYYDGHKDTYLNLDVSSKSEATQFHINFSRALGKVKNAEEIYLVTGKAAPGQIAVFSSEPGEPTYTPLWHEVFVTFKPGATPVLLVKDDQIDDLAKKGVLSTRDTGIVLNCPIIKVGHGGS
jgi:hypothetical protein